MNSTTVNDAAEFLKSGVGGPLAARALIIAISAYPGRLALPQAVRNDAADLVSVLGDPSLCGFDPARIRQLIDDQATLSNILLELDRLAAETAPDDTVLVYFSGHGYRGADDASSLVPFDVDEAQLTATVLSEEKLSEKLAAIRGRRLVVLLDACHAGGAGSLKTALAHEFGVTAKTLVRLGTGTGRVLIASSRADETSHILAGARNSLFTDAVLGALKGATPSRGDGVVRIFELFSYVGPTVAAQHPDQHPIFKASVEDNFPIALRRGGDKSIGTIPEPPSLHDLLARLYPVGPTELEIWVRAGGDLSRLKLQSTGRSNWFGALRTLELGGGGSKITRRSLIETALEDFPHHPGLKSIVE